MEELWEKGEAGGDFDNLSRIIEPDHFQCMFLIMGCLLSVQLLVLLLDILSNPTYGFLKLMLAGLFSCLLFTLVNIFFFSTSLWTPRTRETEERKDNWGEIASPAKTITTGEYDINMEILVNNKTVAFAILGYGAVTSFIFIFVAMIKNLGKNHFLLIDNVFDCFNSGESYYKSYNRIRADREGKRIENL